MLPNILVLAVTRVRILTSVALSGPDSARTPPGQNEFLSAGTITIQVINNDINYTNDAIGGSNS